MKTNALNSITLVRFLGLLIVLFSIRSLSAQQAEYTTIYNAKGLCLFKIIELGGAAPGDVLLSGKLTNCFSQNGNILYVTDAELKSKEGLSSINLYKIDIENTSPISNPVKLDVSNYDISNFEDFKLFNDSVFFLLAKKGLLTVLWTGDSARVIDWNPFVETYFYPTKLKVINDSTLLFYSMNGGMYQEYKIKNIVPTAYAFYSLQKKEMQEIAIIKIPGIKFTSTNNHRFLAGFNSQMVYSTGFDYTLSIENSISHTKEDSIHRKIDDPYWVTADSAQIEYLNSLNKFHDGKQINKSYDSLGTRVSNINAILPLENSDNKFIVFLEYGSKMLKNREFEKGTIDVYEIKNNKLTLLNSNISSPGNMKLADTMDYKHHKFHPFAESCYSEKYVSVFTTELDDEQLRQMKTLQEGKHTLQDYYNYRKPKIAAETPFKKYIYIYRYY